MGRARLAKLRAMGAAEIAGRSAQAIRERVERWTLARSAGSRDERLRLALRRDLRDAGDWREALTRARRANGTRWLESLDDRQSTISAYHRDYAPQRDATRARAAGLLRNDITIFGTAHALGAEIDWHRDPVTGRQWPRVFHRDVPLLDPARLMDPKHVWEINRHQFLIDLAKLALVDDRRDCAAHARNLVGSWIAANPVGYGVNWAGPLEVAYRALSWLWTCWLIGDHDQADPEVVHLWLGGLLDHARFLDRHLELYTSPYNHLIGEAAMLYVLGVMCPEFRDADRWRRRGRQVLETRLDAQFYADGGSVEQALVYHHATIGFYLLAAKIAARHGDAPLAGVLPALERALTFSAALRQPDGKLPAIGDNDDARPILFEPRSTWDCSHYYAMGAVLFNRGDLRAAASSFPEEAFWMLGGAARDRFDRLPASPASPSVVLPHAGYVVLRSGWERDADYVCFDCGEQAGGLRTDEVPQAAHGHADALSAVVSLAGTPVIVDAGFCTYNGDREWERHFRRTRAHNTVALDGADQAEQVDRMAWRHVARVTLESSGVAAGQLWALASHDGYARLHEGVVHRRLVWLRRRYVILADDLSGSGTHDAEVVWQFAPSTRAALAADSAAIGGVRLAWAGTAALVPTLESGGSRPDQGWIAPSLGQPVAAPRLSVAARFTSRLQLLTVIADGSHWPQVGRDAAASLTVTVTGTGAAETIAIDADSVVIRTATEIFTAPLRARSAQLLSR